jgi:hypothetical protein
MVLTLQYELLAKAATNLARVEEYFVARTQWTTPPEGVRELRAVHESLSTLMGAGLRLMLSAHGIEGPYPDRSERIARLPAAELEPERVRRFAAFVDQLGGWFGSQSGDRVAGNGLELLRTLAGSALGATAAVEELLRRHGCSVEPLHPATDAASEAPPPEAVAPEAPAPPEPARERHRDDGPRLVLEDTERTPVTQTYKGSVELTPETRKAIAAFLADAGISLNAYQLNRLERKVLQWVEATPHGTVLVMRVGDLRGQREPVPSYLAKSALK